MMVDIFDAAVAATIGREGRYSADPADRGGATAWGITEATARAAGYLGPMASMSRDAAVDIYRRRYWAAPGFDRIAVLSPSLAIRLFDIGVNTGPPTGIRLLQRALNALNRQASDFADITTDGVFGSGSEAALRAFLARRGADGERVLLFTIAAQQAVHYLEIAERDPTQEAFVFGWLLNRAMAGQPTP